VEPTWLRWRPDEPRTFYFQIWITLPSH